MTIFTDPEAAIDEAVYLANQDDKPFCIVLNGSEMTVVPYYQAWFEKREIIETVTPVYVEDAA